MKNPEEYKRSIVGRWEKSSRLGGRIVEHRSYEEGKKKIGRGL